MNNTQNAVKLIDWQRHSTGPLTGKLTGVPYGHPRLEDGRKIVTTPVQRQFRDGSRLLAQTLNTLYELRRDDGAEWFNSAVKADVQADAQAAAKAKEVDR